MIQSMMVFLFLLAAIEAPVFAYGDPGTGLLLWQLAGAALLGVMFRLRRITGWVSRFTRRDDINS
ncbi:MAG: hypothetical protein IT168_22040 [Bryobacterales bacterium]|nr:hypothetical protein [Bryobacterales bacterium]